MPARDPANITKEQILELARAAGLDPDGARAETIAARLGTALSELGLLADSLAQIEPAPRFVANDAPPLIPPAVTGAPEHHQETFPLIALEDKNGKSSLSS